MLKIALLEGCVYDCDLCYVYLRLWIVDSEASRACYGIGRRSFCIEYFYGINNEGMI